METPRGLLDPKTRFLLAISGPLDGSKSAPPFPSGQRPRYGRVRARTEDLVRAGPVGMGFPVESARVFGRSRRAAVPGEDMDGWVRHGRCTVLFRFGSLGFKTCRQRPAEKKMNKQQSSMNMGERCKSVGVVETNLPSTVFRHSWGNCCSEPRACEVLQDSVAGRVLLCPAGGSTLKNKHNHPYQTPWYRPNSVAFCFISS